jgi:hypothetical protein
MMTHFFFISSPRTFEFDGGTLSITISNLAVELREIAGEDGRAIAAVAACAVAIAGVMAILASRTTDDEHARVVERDPIVRPIAPAVAPPRTITPVKPPSASALRADEIEKTAARSGAAFKACFARTRNPPRKVVVTIEVAPDGDVAKVYSTDEVLTTKYVFEHTPLGRCIHPTVQTWKFRRSSGGIFRFTLVSAS